MVINFILPHDPIVCFPRSVGGETRKKKNDKKIKSQWKSKKKFFNKTEKNDGISIKSPLCLQNVKHTLFRVLHRFQMQTYKNGLLCGWRHITARVKKICASLEKKTYTKFMAAMDEHCVVLDWV